MAWGGLSSWAGWGALSGAVPDTRLSGKAPQARGLEVRRAFRLWDCSLHCFQHSLNFTFLHVFLSTLFFSFLAQTNLPFYLPL